MLPDVQAVLPELSSSGSAIVRPLGKDEVAGYIEIPDVDGRPSLVLRVASSREIIKQGLSGSLWLIMVIGLVSLAFGAVTILLVHRLVLRPMAALRAGAQRIAEGDLGYLLGIDRHDEVGEVASAFDEMSQRLRARNDELHRTTETALREVAERRRAEEALAQERNLLRTLIDNLPDAICVKDLDGRYLLHNQAAAQRIGESNPQETIGKTDFDYFPADLAAQNQVDELQVVRTGEAILNRESAVVDPDNGTGWLLTTKVPWRDREGRTIGIVEIGRDINARKRVEDALRDSEERYRTMIENQGEGLAIVDPSEQLVFCNPAAESLFGVAPGTLVGRNLREFVVSGGSAILEEQTGLRRLGERSVYDVEIVRADGERRTLLVTATPKFDSQGAMVSSVGVFRDITERRRIEAEIHALNEQLEQRVAERTAELTQREAALQAANERLTELDRMKSEFVANISHELRTPLTNIKTGVYLLERGKPEKRSTYLDTLKSETDLLMSLIEGLLRFARLDLPHAPFEMVPLNVSRLSATLVTDSAVMFEQRGVELSIDLPDDLPTITADPHALSEVLAALLTNAVNYTGTGGRVTLSARVRDDVGDAELHLPVGGGLSNQGSSRWLTIVVSDTGPGISDEELPHIFERFYRGQAGRASGTPGTGLGLAICQELVERHNGAITVSTRVGEGSSFTVWLPAQA